MAADTKQHAHDLIERLDSGQLATAVDLLEAILGHDGDEDDPDLKLRLFDDATERHRMRSRCHPVTPEPGDRGWTREELYERGRSR